MNLPDMLEDIPHKVVGDVFYFPKMDNYFYHNGPGISSSNIRRFSQSQLHALEELWICCTFIGRRGRGCVF